jgi:hypothetical protein
MIPTVLAQLASHEPRQPATISEPGIRYYTLCQGLGKVSYYAACRDAMLFRRCRRPAQESLPKQTRPTLFTAGRRSAALVREVFPTIVPRLTLLVDPGVTSFTRLMRSHLSVLFHLCQPYYLTPVTAFQCESSSVHAACPGGSSHSAPTAA